LSKSKSKHQNRLMKNLIITGVTGLLGRNLWFEILKQNQHRLSELQIFLTGRHKHGKTLTQRVLEIYDTEGADYVAVSEEKNQEIRQYIQTKIQFIEFDLLSEDIIPNSGDLQKIQKVSIDHFFHLAALPDLKSDERTAKRTFETNVNGTKNILRLLEKLNLKEFDFVGTAYAAGKATGHILPTYGDVNGAFRNPYEKSKLLAENLVREFAKTSSIRCRYFRPSIVCGRLLENPIGCTSKFDVFYALFSFLWMAKLYHLQSTEKIQTETVSIGLRAIFDTQSGQNIVPVDYVVKMMYQICTTNHPEDSFHLVNPKNMSFAEFLEGASEIMKVTGVEAVSQQPDNLNTIEKMYYQRADMFHDYLLSEPFQFDTSNLKEITQETGLNCPEINKENAKKLIQYAVEQNFGMDLKRVAYRFQRMGVWK